MKVIKNIGRTIMAFFRVIIKFFDKRLITPITKFILFITDKMQKRTGRLEKWLVRRNTLIFISLLIAIIMFFFVDGKSNLLVDSSAEVLYDQKIEVEYNPGYVVEGLPDDVDVTIIGRTVDLYLAKQLSSGKVKIDLRNYREGTYKVPLNYESPISSVNYKLDPSSVTIIVYPKVSENREVEKEIINASKLDSKLAIQSVELIDYDNVVVKGAKHTLDRVAVVKALVDINNIIDPSPGVTTLNDVKLVAYDSNGEVVNVEMEPSKVSATVSIVSPSKEVPIKVIPKGKVKFGKAISSISSDVSKVIVYGDEKVVEELQYVPIYVDVTEMEKNDVFNVTIDAKDINGIRELSVNKAKITVSLGEAETRDIENIQIDFVNLDPNYKQPQAIGEGSSKTTVTVMGTKEVLDALDPSTIKATIDLTGKGEGEHEVAVNVTGDDVKVVYSPKTTKIKIRIVPKE